MRQIDWNVTARTGVPHVRVHLAERALVTWLVLDTSPSMTFGTSERQEGRRRRGRGARDRVRSDQTRQPPRSRHVRRRSTRRRFHRDRDARVLLGLLLGLAHRGAGRRTASGARTGRRRSVTHSCGWATSHASGRTSSSCRTSVGLATGGGHCSRSAAAITSWRSRSATPASRSCRAMGDSVARRPRDRPAPSGRHLERAAAVAVRSRRGQGAPRDRRRARLGRRATRRALDPGRLVAPADDVPQPRGSAMSFASPLALLALLLVPAAAAGYIWFQRRRVRDSAGLRRARAAAEHRRSRPRLATAPPSGDPPARRRRASWSASPDPTPRSRCDRRRPRRSS